MWQHLAAAAAEPAAGLGRVMALRTPAHARPRFSVGFPGPPVRPRRPHVGSGWPPAGSAPGPPRRVAVDARSRPDTRGRWQARLYGHRRRHDRAPVPAGAGRGGRLPRTPGVRRSIGAVAHDQAAGAARRAAGAAAAAASRTGRGSSARWCTRARAWAAVASKRNDPARAPWPGSSSSPGPAAASPATLPSTSGDPATAGHRS